MSTIVIHPINHIVYQVIGQLSYLGDPTSTSEKARQFQSVMSRIQSPLHLLQEVALFRSFR